MKKKDIVQILAGENFSVIPKSSGELYAASSGDSIIGISVIVRNYLEYNRTVLWADLTSKIFSDIANSICPSESNYYHMIVHPDGQWRHNNPDKDAIRNYISDAKNWASTINLEEVIEEFTEYGPKSKGQNIIKHLSSLAYTNQLDKLRAYKENIQKGNSMGFMPFVSDEMIERAILCAESQHEKIINQWPCPDQRGFFRKLFRRR